MYKILLCIVIIFSLISNSISQENNNFLTKLWGNIQQGLKTYDFEVDKKGGIELIYKVKESNTDIPLSHSVDVIYKRLEKSKILKSPRIYTANNLIIIQVPSLNNAELLSVKKYITSSGNLEFRLIASSKIGEGIDETVEKRLYKKNKLQNRETFVEYNKKLLEKGYKWYVTQNNDDIRLVWINDGYNWTGNKFKKFYITYVHGRRVIAFEIKNELRYTFGKFTENYIKENLAIIFKNKVISAPVIANRIEGRGILCGFDMSEYVELLNILQSGALGVKLKLLEENRVEASLKKDNKIEKYDGILFQIKAKQNFTKKMLYDTLSKFYIVRIQKTGDHFYIHVPYKKYKKAEKFTTEIRFLSDSVYKLKENIKIYKNDITVCKNGIKENKKDLKKTISSGQKNVERINWLRDNIKSRKNRIKKLEKEIPLLYLKIKDKSKKIKELKQKKSKTIGLTNIKKDIQEKLKLKEDDFKKILLISQAYLK